MTNDEGKKNVMKVDDGAYGVREVKMNYPSNSHKKCDEKEEPKKIDKVISGKVVTRKKSLTKRFIETFVGEGGDISSVFGYIIHDVLIPAAKDTLEDMVKGSIEMMLHGERKGSRTKRDNGRSYVSYNSYSSSRDRDRRDERKPDMSSRNRARHNFDDIILESRGEAEQVLSDLVDLIIDYGQATVANLYDMVGITENFTDSKYGWVDLRSASVSRVRDGYLLNLPKTVLLD